MPILNVGADMKRREFIKALAGSGLAWPLAARAQRPAMPVVGVLRVNPKDTNETFAEPFQRYMKALGWEEGRNVRLQFVWAGGQIDRMPALAAELVAQKVDLIVTSGFPAIAALERATTTIPIVALADDMIATGLASNLRRMRAGNMTGVSILSRELDVKRLEILHEFVPKARRIGVLADRSESPSFPELESAAHKLGVELFPLQLGSGAEIDRALDQMLEAKVEALNVLASPMLYSVHHIIIARMRKARLPVIFQWPEAAAEGSFLAYGPRLLLAYRRVSVLVDKILRGASPADLPIEQPDRFELIINLKVAQELELTIPSPLLLRADEVIE